jgi:ribosomal protein S18 acetylase RimI-like enzyme
MSVSIGVTYRQANSEDWKGIYDLYSSLSQEDLYLRFFSFHKISEEEVKKLVSDFSDHTTVVAVINNLIVGEATIFSDGEFALVVHPSYRRQGIGTELVKRLIKIAKLKGICKVKFYTLPDNYPMIRIGKKLGFKIKEDEDEVIGLLNLC